MKAHASGFGMDRDQINITYNNGDRCVAAIVAIGCGEPIAQIVQNSTSSDLNSIIAILCSVVLAQRTEEVLADPDEWKRDERQEA